MHKYILITLSITCITMMSQKVKAQAKITHIAVFVSNLEQSTAFYKDVMDFEEIEEPFKDGLHAWFDIGNNLQLHVIEDKWQPITINKNNHICFSIPDMDVFISKLNDKNVAFENWVGEKGKINVRPDGIKQVYLRDPDGYWIEINNEYN